jgi:glycosyltransferase involved in cell wall biosynthesis
MTVVFSVIFPNNLPYFPSFLKSLEKQTNQDFKLVLINDGVVDLDYYLQQLSFEYVTYFVKNLTPFEVRIFGLRQVLKLNPDFILFADTDDLFSTNRVEKLLNKLEVYPFVCNDIDLINEYDFTIAKSYWGRRFKGDFEFDIHFLKNKNIIGLGNAGMQAWPLNQMANKLDQISNGNDWLFFSSAENDLKGLFVCGCSTHYRQHDNNQIGKKKLDEKSLIKIIEGRIDHYKYLLKIGFSAFDVEKELTYNQNLHNWVFNNQVNAQNQLSIINNLNYNFLWWEEPDFLKFKL